MQEANVGLSVGGHVVFLYMDYRNEDNFKQGADNEERVDEVLDAFV